MYALSTYISHKAPTLTAHMDKPYHHGNLRTALLEAAHARLSEVGEADLSLRDLATRVGVSVNASYRHFSNKEALLMELSAMGFDTLRTRMLESIEEVRPLGPEHHLRAAGQAYTAFARQDPGLYKLMFGRKGRFGAQARLLEAANAAFDVVIDCVAKLRGASTDSAEAVKAAAGVWSMVHGYAMLDIGGYLAGMAEQKRPTAAEVLRLLAVDA